MKCLQCGAAIGLLSLCGSVTTIKGLGKDKDFCCHCCAEEWLDKNVRKTNMTRKQLKDCGEALKLIIKYRTDDDFVVFVPCGDGDRVFTGYEFGGKITLLCEGMEADAGEWLAFIAGPWYVEAEPEKDEGLPEGAFISRSECYEKDIEDFSPIYLVPVETANNAIRSLHRHWAEKFTALEAKHERLSNYRVERDVAQEKAINVAYADIRNLNERFAALEAKVEKLDRFINLVEGASQGQECRLRELERKCRNHSPDME